MEKVILWGTIDAIALGAICWVLIGMVVRAVRVKREGKRANRPIYPMQRKPPLMKNAEQCKVCKATGIATGPCICKTCNGLGWVEHSEQMTDEHKQKMVDHWRSFNGYQPASPLLSHPPATCNHNHAKWRLDLTKEITRFKKMCKGPGDYTYHRNAFIRAFELNDPAEMEIANDKMKEIELNAGITNDVDIIERLIQIKKVGRGREYVPADELRQVAISHR